METAPYITFRELVGLFEIVLFDSDGVLVSWPSPVPHAPEAIDFLNSSGKQYFVLTNDASMAAATRAARYLDFGPVH